MQAQGVDDFVTSAIALACQAPPSALVAHASLVDINVDSLALASVVGQVEAVYSIEFDPEQIMKMLYSSTVGEVIETVRQVLAGRS